MSDAFYYRGLTIEFDLSVPRAYIEGREISAEYLSSILALTDPALRRKSFEHMISSLLTNSQGLRKEKLRGKTTWRSSRKE
jgi:hypothetical protein